VKALGFAPNYDGIAKALVAQGAASTPTNWQTSPYGEPRYTIADRLHGRRDKVDGRGCETSAAGCQDDGYSEVCPFSFNDYFMVFWNSINWKGTSRDQQMAFETKMLGQMQSIADGIFSGTQNAIGAIVTQIMVTATVLQVADTQAAVAAASDSKIAAKAAAGAAYAEAAAKRASSWSAATRESALVAAQNGYDVARQARAVLTLARAPGAPPVVPSLKRDANAAVDRAAVALAKAKSNALHAQLMMGGAAAAGVVAVGYLLLRK